ncbi:phosphoribosylglycinamide formyltransferase [Thiosulfativibrio zosterae]|nr:phosphoribosylglycinamide formyltransferase [Thiosulfativibrio zosterae]
MKIAVLISGSGSNLQALIDYQSHAHYEIALVISNRPQAYGLVRAQNANIPTLVLDHTTYADRLTFDKALMAALDDAKIEGVILAGFMRILTPEFTQHFLGRMLNIHPSLLPKYPGLHTHQRALEAKDSQHGVSIHFVTPELDGGPVILQSVIQIADNDTPETLQDKIHQEEYKIYPLVTDWLAQGKIQLVDNQALFNQKVLSAPLVFQHLE